MEGERIGFFSEILNTPLATIHVQRTKLTPHDVSY